MTWAKQSTAATLIVGPILDSAGAEFTTAVISDISLSKNGGTLTALAAAATLTHIANGQYTLALTTGNTDTLGRAQLTCNRSTYQMPPLTLTILPAMVFDSMVLGTDVLQSDVTQFGGNNGTFSGGRPEVNATHWGGTAVGSANVLIDNAITAAKIAADAIGADEISAAAVTKIQSGLATASGVSAVEAKVDTVDTVVDAIKVSTDNLPPDPADQSLIIAATNAIVADTEDIQARLPAALVSGRMDASVGAMQSNTLSAAAVAADAVTEIQSGLATEANVDAVEAKVDTLLSRVTSTLFSGITSMAQWLGMLAGKQTGDITARTEIRATGAGAGAYNETTDSLEAIRDRGDAAWITGSGGGGSGTGAYTIAITVQNTSSAALQNATVRMSEGANSYTATTNASGVATFALDAATYSVAITKGGYQFTPTTLAVSSSDSQTYQMSTVTITPSEPTETTGYITVYTAARVVVSGATVELQLTRLKNGTTGSGINDALVSRTTNASGYAEFTGLPRGAAYQLRINTGPWYRGTTAEAATTPLVGTIGPAV
jgi:hypothetical protein